MGAFGEQDYDRAGNAIPRKKKKKMEDMKIDNSIGQVNPSKPQPTPMEIIDEEMMKRKGKFYPD